MELDLLYIAPSGWPASAARGSSNACMHSSASPCSPSTRAHCVSQWGTTSARVPALSALHERYPDIPRIALTATADEATRNEIIQRLGPWRSADLHLQLRPPEHPRYTVVEKDKPRRQLLGFLADRKGEAGIVYCLSRKKVEETADWLNEQGFSRPAPSRRHGRGEPRRQPAPLPARGRRRHLRDDRLRHGHRQARRALRRPSGSAQSLEAYYQETGRAGRDGESSSVDGLYGLQDVVLQRSRIDESNAPPEQKRLEAQKLNALLAYCEAPRCRRVVLLDYFGEATTPCGNCDVCLDPPETIRRYRRRPEGTLRHLSHRPAFRRPACHRRAAGQEERQGRAMGHDRSPSSGSAPITTRPNGAP